MQVKMFKKIAQHGMFQHLLFWAISFYLLLRFFSKEYGDTFSNINLIYTGLFHISLFVTVYPNLLFLIPNILQKGKIVIFAIFFTGTFLLGIYVNLLTFNHLSEWLFPDYYFISFYEVKDIAQFMLIYLVLTTLLKLSKGWFQLIENNQKLSLLEREKLNAELSALKSQINPHFLFNSLNNLYALALDKDEKTAPLILKLSKGLRYMLYESNEHFVPLENEIEYLENYLELQKLRSNQKVKIDFFVEGEVEGKQIAPMLFIPFVENGFKHGVKGEIDNAFIKIQLQATDNQLVFKSENNKGQVDEVEPEKYRGIGLSNVKRRLELLYPERYKLNILDGIDTFSVELIIRLQKQPKNALLNS